MLNLFLYILLLFILCKYFYDFVLEYNKPFFNKKEIQRITKDCSLIKEFKIKDIRDNFNRLYVETDNEYLFVVMLECDTSNKDFCKTLLNEIKIGETYKIRYTTSVIHYDNGFVKEIKIYYLSMFITYLENNRGEILINKEYILY